eukprot:CAMPEP_0173278854 /NCGR_PEP_ID=MMETSP1143-20121109/4841_1 /TAXON_ID=483371 /ORGANISM="non described non described, Strain CCMP2298" /LENGTH=189 /DNA_ID=CAMNT_0014216051 /DNA_START=532 /DNA_END=1098 /DNA_ORIENTATION=-
MTLTSKSLLFSGLRSSGFGCPGLLCLLTPQFGLRHPLQRALLLHPKQGYAVGQQLQVVLGLTAAQLASSMGVCTSECSSSVRGLCQNSPSTPAKPPIPIPVPAPPAVLARGVSAPSSSTLLIGDMGLWGEDREARPVPGERLEGTAPGEWGTLAPGELMGRRLMLCACALVCVCACACACVSPASASVP